MKKNQIENFNVLLKEKKEILEKFLHLTEEQGKALVNSDYDRIINILNEKQNLIEKVNLLDLEIKDDIFESEEAKDMFKEIKEIIARAIEQDEKNIQLIKKNRDEIAEKLKNARKNKGTHFRYRGKTVAIEGVLLDKKK